MLDSNGVSSNKMRLAGEKSSSNCLFFTPHKKAAKNKDATLILAINKIMITPIAILYGVKSISRHLRQL